MEFYLVLVVFWALIVIASGVLNVQRRKNNLNLAAFCIYCVGFTWALAESLSVLLMVGEVYGEARLVFSWLPAAGIVGFLAWRWWTANHPVAVPSAGGVAMSPALPKEAPVPILSMSERALALLWLGSSVGLLFFMAFVFDENNWNLIKEISGAYCGGNSYRTICYADAESGAFFGAFTAFVIGGILVLRRRRSFGRVEHWIYGVGLGLSGLAMVFFWLVGSGEL